MYDITVIGSGPGGYAAATRAAQLGAKTCIIEKGHLGGTCLNVGCIPTKSIIHSTEILRNIKASQEFGIRLDGYSIDMSSILRRKDEVVSKLRHGIEVALKSKGVDIIKARATFCDANRLKVDGRDISSEHFIIATGSEVSDIGNIKIDHANVISSDDILDVDKMPHSLVIIGGGFIGCEFASIYNQLGAKVTIVELMDQLLPSQDREIARRLQSYFKRSGIDVLIKSEVSAIDNGNGVKVHIKGGVTLMADKALVCIGRIPSFYELNLEAAGVITKDGKIEVDDHLRTNIPNIYAIGDVKGGHYLAHVASYEGNVASENILGKGRIVDYTVVPSCIFTYPEISSVGMNEETARHRGIDCAVTKLPFAAVSKAHILGESGGFIKTISDKADGRLLGACIYGPSASELITAFSIAIKKEISLGELGDIIYAHPTLSELISGIADKIKEG